MTLNEGLRKISVAYSAGSAGALLSSLLEWALGYAGITQMLNAKNAPDLSVDWLFLRLVWGGLWGLMFLIPFFQHSYFRRGFLYSIPPALALLLIVYPGTGMGMLGLKMGNAVPFLAVFFNMVWAICAVTWLKICER